MVEKCRRSVSRQISEYRRAISGFTHNASKYLASGFLQGLGAGMLATVFGIYLKSTGMSEGVVGAVEGATAFSAAVICLVGPPLVARLGYRKMMVAAVALIVLSRLGQATLPLTIAVIGLALAIGLGDGFMRAISSAFMSENSEDDHRTHLFSTELVVRVLAGFLGGLFGGFMPKLLQIWFTEVQSYQGTIIAGTLIIGTGLLPMLKIKEQRELATSLKDAYYDSIRHFRSWRHLFKLIFPQAFISLAGGMVIPFIPLYLKHQLGADIGQIGIIQGLASVILAFGVFGTPYVVKKVGMPQGVAMLQLASVPFLALVPLAGSLMVAVGLLWARGAVMNMAGPIWNQFSMEGVPDREKPIVAGGMFFALNMMWLVGNLVGGKLMEINYTLPYVPAVFLYATGASLTYLLWRKAGARVAEEAGEAARA